MQGYANPSFKYYTVFKLKHNYFMVTSFKKWGILSLIAVSATLATQSCDNDDDYNYHLPNAIVTVKHAESGNSSYLQLDDSTTLLPINMTTSPFGDKEVRAFTNFTYTDDDSGDYDATVTVNWIDSILTKQPAPNMGEKNDSIYGSDPVELIGDWFTIVEDGYITLRFRTIWGPSGIPHYVNLITNTNSEDPYEVEFRHNASGDTYGTIGDAVVAFSIKDLPDTEGKNVKIRVKYKSPSGYKYAEFKYNSGKSSGGTVPREMLTRRIM